MGSWSQIGSRIPLSELCNLQGLPFSVSGVRDLLALFRCTSCRYKFSTDVSKPCKMVSSLACTHAACKATGHARDLHWCTPDACAPCCCTCAVKRCSAGPM